MNKTVSTQLRSLARFYHIQTSYFDVSKQRRLVSLGGLLRLLQALGAPIEKESDISDAYRTSLHRQWQQPLEPVLMAWDGRIPPIPLHLPDSLGRRHLELSLQLENGEAVQWNVNVSDLLTLSSRKIEGTSYHVKELRVPPYLLLNLPMGYHHLTVDLGESQFRSLLISAPTKAYSPQAKRTREWGIFLPLYALQSSRSWGIGDFTDLRHLTEWIQQEGGSLVATLPLLAIYLDPIFDPSPYAPVSRLFWNELYADIAQAPESKACSELTAYCEAATTQKEKQSLHSTSFVEYRRVLDLKRTALRILSRAFFKGPSLRREEFERFLVNHAELQDYARFRATTDHRQEAWPYWPDRQKEGILKEEDFEPDSYHYYLYTQWIATEQLHTLSEQSRQKGQGLYLDLPLGVHSAGYDVWKERSAFVLNATGGAPPDSVFTCGQDWGFAPLHPEGIRKEEYRYVRKFLQHHMREAGILRIDHVMGLHRLFMIPKGLETHQGAYVRYRPDELYGILSVESHRHRTMLVGENLGTVPGHINKSLIQHRLSRMYVVQYELNPRRDPPLPSIPRDAVASLNTHDMPPYTAYWKGLDLDDRLERGLLDDNEAQAERRQRDQLRENLATYLHKRGLVSTGDPDLKGILQGTLDFLGKSAAALVLINLEDLWLEIQAQNVPASADHHPNWTRKARYTLEEIKTHSDVMAALVRMNALRQGRTLPQKSDHEPVERQVL